MRLIGLAVILTLGLTLAPLAAGAQQNAKVYRLGFLWGPAPVGAMTAAFEQGLRDLGWLNGLNITIEHRSAEGKLERLPALAAELVSLRVDLIVADSAPATSAAKYVTRSTPIVFVVHGDPVAAGDVQSLSRPGGNITGLTLMHPAFLSLALGWTGEPLLSVLSSVNDRVRGTNVDLDMSV
jgi:putative ABC transport system substrate-binding protein